MHNSSETSKRFNGPVSFIILSVIAILICMASALLFSIIITNEKLSADYLSYAAYVSVFIGVFAVSPLSAKKFGKAFLTSLIQGFSVFCLLYISGALIFGRLFSPEHIWGVAAACVFGAIAGALISAAFKRKKH